VEGKAAVGRRGAEAAVLAALEGAGQECLATFGHGFDTILEQPIDEAVHTKAVYIARSA
jgi:hypothetical protein